MKNTNHTEVKVVGAIITIPFLLSLLFLFLVFVPAEANQTEPVDIRFLEMQEGVIVPLITIYGNGTVWIDPSLSREDIVKEMFGHGWPCNYERIYGGKESQ